MIEDWGFLIFEVGKSAINNHQSAIINF